MKRIIAFLVFLLSFTAKAEAVKLATVCVAEWNECAYVSNNNMWLPPTMLAKVDAETKARLQEIGVTVGPLVPHHWGTAKPTTEIHVSIDKAIADVSQAADDFAESAFGCVGAIAGCMSATAAVPTLGPFGLFLTKVGCGAAGGVCVYTLVKYDKWQKQKKEEKQAKDKEKEAAGRGDGGSEGVGAPPDGSATDIQEMRPRRLPTGHVIIHESKGGSGGGSLTGIRHD